MDMNPLFSIKRTLSRFRYFASIKLKFIPHTRRLPSLHSLVCLMADGKKNLASKFIRDTTNNEYYNEKMPPAATENSSDALIALNYETNPDLALASVGAANLNSSVALARAMFEEQQRKQKDAEEKILAIVRARQVEAMKVQELDLARAIRRHHEDEQVQKHILSLHREREILKRDPKLFSRAISVDDGKLRTDAPSRKRLFEGDMFLRNVLQRQQDELTLLNDIRTATRIGNEDDKLFPMKVPRHQNMLSPAASRLLPMNFENNIISLPLSSRSPSQNSLQLQSMSMTSSLSSRTSTFLEDQAPSLLHQRNTAQFNLQDFHNDGSESILNSIYSSVTGPRSSDQDISSLSKFYGVNAIGRSVSGKVDKTNVNMPVSGTNPPSLAHAGLASNWLRPSTHGVTTNSGIMVSSVPQEDKGGLEGQYNLIGDRTRTSEKYVGVNDDTKSDPEGDLQQKRFNKHQCKQWTLKFHELLAFKEKTGHW